MAVLLYLLSLKSALTYQAKRQIDSEAMDMLVTSGSLGGPMVSTLAENVKDMDSILFSRCIYHFHHTNNTGAITRILYKLQTEWLLNLPCV